MLNTDLHSPHVKRKMTPTDFINNTRFGPSARTLPAELLEVLYENVASVEFRMGPTTGEPGAEAAKRKNWGLGKTAKKLGLKKPERAGGKFGTVGRSSTMGDAFGSTQLSGMDAKRTLQRMFSWATSGSLKRKMGWAIGGDVGIWRTRLRYCLWSLTISSPVFCYTTIDSIGRISPGRH